MKDSKISPDSEAGKCLRRFNEVLPLKVKLQEIIRQLDHTGAETCLEIGANNGGISYYLRKCGGEWHTAVTTADAAESVKSVVGENVHLLNGGALPFKKDSFDIVIVVDLLEITDSDETFIEDCHRVLKSDGQLLINVARSVPLTPVAPLRRMLARELGKKPDLYAGYTEPELFTLLKHGFDVHRVRKYSRIGVELVDLIVRLIAMRIKEKGGKEAEISRVYSVARFFYWFAYQLDLLMFLGKGYHLLAVAQRRSWRSRNAPILTDGRMLSDAVLSPLK